MILILFSTSKSDNDKFDVKQSSHFPIMQTSRLESQAFASNKSCTLVAKIFDLRLGLELIPFAKSAAFSWRSYSQEDCGIWSSHAPYVPLKTHLVDENLDHVETFHERRYIVR